MSTAKVQPGNFDDFRQYYFDEIAQDKGTMFNFFFLNNEIFQNITKGDSDQINNAYLRYMNRMTGMVFGTYASIFFLNNYVMRKTPKYPNFRLTIFCGKWIALPLIAYGLGKSILTRDSQRILESMADKYNFGYNDYNRAMDTYERAHRVGRLDELIEKGQNFDWSSVPEFKSKYFID